MSHFCCGQRLADSVNRRCDRGRCLKSGGGLLPTTTDSWRWMQVVIDSRSSAKLVLLLRRGLGSHRRSRSRRRPSRGRPLLCSRQRCQVALHLGLYQTGQLGSKASDPRPKPLAHALSWRQGGGDGRVRRGRRWRRVGRGTRDTRLVPRSKEACRVIWLRGWEGWDRTWRVL